MGLSKSGYNKFAGYTYFELGDFIPHINTIFNEIGLCGVVSFTHEEAVLIIYDCDSEATIRFSSPMAEAHLKGCHPIQNLGAVQTYQRRYLWIEAMEIVEQDSLDATTGDETKPVDQDNEKPWYNDFDQHRAAMIAKINSNESTAAQIIGNLRKNYKVSKKIADQITELGINN